jgi:hypothetical protein
MRSEPEWAILRCKEFSPQRRRDAETLRKAKKSQEKIKNLRAQRRQRAQRKFSFEFSASLRLGGGSLSAIY